jgi:hypothetical protein
MEHLRLGFVEANTRSPVRFGATGPRRRSNCAMSRPQTAPRKIREEIRAARDLRDLRPSQTFSLSTIAGNAYRVVRSHRGCAIAGELVDSRLASQ